MQEAWEARQAALYDMGTEEALREMRDHKKLIPEVERQVNEHVRASLEATGEPVDVSKYKEPVMYYRPGDATGRLPASICTCGKSKSHTRLKVLKQWSEKHYAKTGHKPAPLEES